MPKAITVSDVSGHNSVTLQRGALAATENGVQMTAISTGAGGTAVFSNTVVQNGDQRPTPSFMQGVATNFLGVEGQEVPMPQAIQDIVAKHKSQQELVQKIGDVGAAAQRDSVEASNRLRAGLQYESLLDGLTFPAETKMLGGFFLKFNSIRIIEDDQIIGEHLPKGRLALTDHRLLVLSSEPTYRGELSRQGFVPGMLSAADKNGFQYRAAYRSSDNLFYRPYLLRVFKQLEFRLATHTVASSTLTPETTCCKKCWSACCCFCCCLKTWFATPQPTMITENTREIILYLFNPPWGKKAKMVIEVDQTVHLDDIRAFCQAMQTISPGLNVGRSTRADDLHAAPSPKSLPSAAPMQRGGDRNSVNLAPGQYPPASYPNPNIMEVTCPLSSRPGSIIEIVAPNGAKLNVQVPNGVAPGGTFTADLGLAAAAAAPIQVNAQYAPTTGSAAQGYPAPSVPLPADPEQGGKVAVSGAPAYAESVPVVPEAATSSSSASASASASSSASASASASAAPEPAIRQARGGRRMSVV